jgi:hypothetical protein
VWPAQASPRSWRSERASSWPAASWSSFSPIGLMSASHSIPCSQAEAAQLRRSVHFWMSAAPQPSGAGRPLRAVRKPRTKDVLAGAAHSRRPGTWRELKIYVTDKDAVGNTITAGLASLRGIWSRDGKHRQAEVGMRAKVIIATFAGMTPLTSPAHPHSSPPNRTLPPAHGKHHRRSRR